MQQDAVEVKSFVADGPKRDMEMAPCHSVSLEQAHAQEVQLCVTSSCLSFSPFLGS